MFVVIGNPPYNAGQVNENDNNKNRKYETMDQRVAGTYARDSRATLKTKLSDPYVKAIRWASDRIGEQGIVAFVTNNSFLDDISFDGMRKHLANDFDSIYVLDLGGNLRKHSGVSNVFGIRVGVSINFFIKKKKRESTRSSIFYVRVEETKKKEDKFHYLDLKKHYQNIEWQPVTPNQQNTWLTEGMRTEFENFIPIGRPTAKLGKDELMEVMFHRSSLGVSTNRDAWVYNFNRNTLTENMQRTIECYNEQVFKWERRTNRKSLVDDFVVNDDTKISWSRDLKLKLKRGSIAEYSEFKVRNSLYRPFTKSNLFFDRILNDVKGSFPTISPTPEAERENRVICVSGLGSRKPFHALMAKMIPSLDMFEKTQCFPFYVYDKDGTHRRENITDWALQNFGSQYQEEGIGKEDIFHYIYAVLHHTDYRETYQANLKRELPRIPFLSKFWDYVEAGRRLADLHVGYEAQPEYPLEWIETPGTPLDWRVEKMKLSKDKTEIRYNDFLTLTGVPPEVFEYQLDQRSALDWVINQYRVKTDKRSRITNDPNRPDDPQYIIKLIGKVITISLETVNLVKGLPEWPKTVPDKEWDSL